MSSVRTTFERFIHAPDLVLTSEAFPYAPFVFSEDREQPKALHDVSQVMLGKQAEYYFQHYLASSQRYELLASNIQIQGTTETLGEIDYLVYDRQTAQHCHIELACKFYLYDDRMPSEYERWMGPNRKDTLYEKVTKLAQKQFQMLFTSEAKPILTELEIDPQYTVQQLCLKAFLFLPKGKETPHISENFKKCIVGEWMHWEDFQKEKETTSLYAIPEKKQWLNSPESLTDWHSLSETKEIIALHIKNRKAPLVYAKSKGAIRFFFIVYWH